MIYILIWFGFVAIVMGIILHEFFKDIPKIDDFYKSLYNHYTAHNQDGLIYWSPVTYDLNNKKWVNRNGEGDHLKYIQYINDIPRITFNQWLNYYQINPQRWHIDKNREYINSEIPYYVSKKNGKLIFLPVFWTNYKELKKFHKWVKKDYNSYFVNDKQRKNYDELIQCLSEDLGEQISELREEISKDC